MKIKKNMITFGGDGGMVGRPLCVAIVICSFFCILIQNKKFLKEKPPWSGGKDPLVIQRAVQNPAKYDQKAEKRQKQRRASRTALIYIYNI